LADGHSDTVRCDIPPGARRCVSEAEAYASDSCAGAPGGISQRTVSLWRRQAHLDRSRKQAVVGKVVACRISIKAMNFCTAGRRALHR